MTLSSTWFGEHRGRPLLVLGPSLGTSATTLWGACAAQLQEEYDVLSWELPGHGGSPATDTPGLTVADLARDVLALVDAVLADREDDTFHYAGNSVGGAVGLQLLVDAPARVRSAVLLCTAPSFDGQQAWAERVATVRAGGTAALVTSSAERWFAPGFLEREPVRGSALLHDLQSADDDGYVAVCGALGRFDVRDRLGDIGTPVLAVAGAADRATPADRLQEIVDGVRDGRLIVLGGVAHLAPAEAPVEVARLVREHAAAADQPAVREDRTVAQVRDAGMAVRREVLGDAHVDRATATATELVREFQDLITEYAWGSIWARPGLDRRSRSMVTLTALVARGHHGELAMHVLAARRNGLSVDEIKEVLLQTMIYCGVPDANTAFRIAQQALAEEKPGP